MTVLPLRAEVAKPGGGALLSAALLVLGSFDKGEHADPDGRENLLANVARLRRAVAAELEGRPRR